MRQKQKARPKPGFLWVQGWCSVGVQYLVCPARGLPRDRARRAARFAQSILS
jgi:hypothetical protein